MIVQHWTSINIVSVKPLGITSVFHRHLNLEKRKISEFHDFEIKHLMILIHILLHFIP